MSKSKEELAAAIGNILKPSEGVVDTLEKANQLRLTFATNLATELHGYIQYQISASLIPIHAEINSLQIQLNQLRTNITGSSV